MWIMKTEEINYGISFWLCVGTICLFAAVVTYEKISMSNMEKRKMILDLINEERKIRALDDENKS